MITVCNVHLQNAATAIGCVPFCCLQQPVWYHIQIQSTKFLYAVFESDSCTLVLLRLVLPKCDRDIKEGKRVLRGFLLARDATPLPRFGVDGILERVRIIDTGQL